MKNLMGVVKKWFKVNRKESKVQRYKNAYMRVFVVRDGGAPVKQVCAPRDVIEIMRARLQHKDREQFEVICLNSRNVICGIETVSVGILDASLVHPRETFKAAILCGASGIVCAHNHPSGNTTPSDDDRKLTRRLVEAGKLLGIEVLDHVIITDDDFYSFKENKAL